MNSVSSVQSVAQEGASTHQREEESMRVTPTVRTCLLAGAAFFMMAPNFAAAQTPASRADLEARLDALSREVATLRAQLDAQRAADAQTDQKIVTLETRVNAPPPPPAPPPEGMRVGDSTVKITGFVKAEALMSDFGDGAVPTGLVRDFYLPSAIPVGAPGAAQDFVTDAHVKQSRIMLTATTPVAGTTVTTYVEGDFQTSAGTQGSERTTNGYNFAIRRAYIGFGDWLFGQDWSTFQNVATLPETPDFIGPTEGTVFVRQPLVRFTAKIDDKSNFQFALENPETASVTPASATLVENDFDQLPDLIARYNVKTDFGDFTVAGLVRQLRVASGASDESETGWGLSASGKIKVGAEDDIRLMLTHGEGIGRYVGLNFAADASNTATGFEAIGVTAGFAAYRHVWAKDLRSTLTYSFQNVDNKTGVSPTQANDSAWSAAVNLFYSPLKGVDLGVEYRHGERELFNGQSGDLDRLHFVAKRTF